MLYFLQNFFLTPYYLIKVNLIDFLIPQSITPHPIIKNFRDFSDFKNYPLIVKRVLSS